MAGKAQTNLDWTEVLPSQGMYYDHYLVQNQTRIVIHTMRMEESQAIEGMA